MSARFWRRPSVAALAFIGPAALAVVLLRLAPALKALADALTTPNGALGIGNFTFLFDDPDFRNAARVTLVFSLVVNPLQIGLALALALLMSQRSRGAAFYRTALLLPTAIPQSVSAVIWGAAFRPDGLVNSLLASLGMAPQPFLTSQDQALACIVVVVSWIGVGYWMTFLIAGLNDIPAAVHEAARIDGAGAWQRFRFVTLPLLRRPLLFVLVADTVANFLVFAPVQALTGGGPVGSTDLMMHNIFTRAFITNDTGAAAAQTCLLVTVVVLVVVVQFRLLGARAGDA